MQVGSVVPTVALYIRIPVALRKRLDDAASTAGGSGDYRYSYRGAIADTAIKALEAGLDAIAPDTKDAPAKSKSKSKQRSRK
jgi:hypothetical protein